MLELQNITKTYKTNDFIQNALDDVSIKFKKGELTTILGESGSGKSTLLNILSGLDKPTKGKVIIDGIDTSKFSKADWATYRNHFIGFIFQEYNLINNLSALDNVMMPLLLQGVSNKEAKSRAIEKLKLVGLEEHIYKLPIQLSGGQCQRVSIARALVTEPKVIMADEPTGALDYELGLKTINFIKKICSDKIIILVTHDLEIANTFSDRIVEMKDGKIISDTSSIVEDNEIDTFELKKPKLKLGMMIKLAKKNISSRILRTLFTSITVSIGLICVFCLAFLGKGVTKTLSDVLNEVLPKKVYTIEPYSSAQILTSSDYDKIKNIENVNELNYNYTASFIFTNEDKDMYSYTTTIPNNKHNFVNENKLIGEYPNNENEFLVSVGFVENMFGVNLKSEADIEYYLNRINYHTFDTCLDKSTSYPLKITGIVNETTLFTSSQAYFRQDTFELFKNNENNIEYSTFSLYLNDYSDSKATATEKAIEDLEYVCVNNHRNLTEEVESFFNGALKVLSIFTIISLIVSGILIALIVYTSITERVREIGILNAIGARGKHISGIFIIESVIIGLVSAFVGFVLAYLLSQLGNLIFNDLVESLVLTVLPNSKVSVKVFRIDFIVVLLVFVFCIIYTALIGFIPALKARKINAVEALRKE